MSSGWEGSRVVVGAQAEAIQAAKRGAAQAERQRAAGEVELAAPDQAQRAQRRPAAQQRWQPVHLRTHMSLKLLHLSFPFHHSQCSAPGARNAHACGSHRTSLPADLTLGTLHEPAAHSK